MKFVWSAVLLLTLTACSQSAPKTPGDAIVIPQGAPTAPQQQNVAPAKP